MRQHCREVDWFKDENLTFTPKSTTHDMLETAIREKARFYDVSKKQINFMSYPLSDSRLKLLAGARDKGATLSTTYRETFVPPYNRPSCPIKTDTDLVPDPLLNRKPLNPFGMKQSLEHKFMDDQFINVSEPRKRIDFMRQLRNAHFQLG